MSKTYNRQIRVIVWNYIRDNAGASIEQIAQDLGLTYDKASHIACELARATPPQVSFKRETRIVDGLSTSRMYYTVASERFHLVPKSKAVRVVGMSPALAAPYELTVQQPLDLVPAPTTDVEAVMEILNDMTFRDVKKVRRNIDEAMALALA